MKWWIVGLVAVVAVVVLWALFPVRELTQAIVAEVQGFGPWGIALYFVLYVALAAVTFPTTPLNIGAG